MAAAAASASAAAAPPVHPRMERMMRQEAELIKYVEALPIRKGFPFARRTVDLPTSTNRAADLEIRPSYIRPYMGVFCKSKPKGDFIAPYPGYVLTITEYLEMANKLVIPTACDAQELNYYTKWRDEPGYSKEVKAKKTAKGVDHLDEADMPAAFVIVGLPTSMGANVMCNYKYTKVLPANAKLGYGQEKGKPPPVDTHSKPMRVGNDYIAVLRTEGRHGKALDAGSELIVATYSPGFFNDHKDHCDICFKTRGPLISCSRADCAMKYHAKCQPHYTGGEFVCTLHKAGMDAAKRVDTARTAPAAGAVSSVSSSYYHRSPPPAAAAAAAAAATSSTYHMPPAASTRSAVMDATLDTAQAIREFAREEWKAKFKDKRTDNRLDVVISRDAHVDMAKLPARIRELERNDTRMVAPVYLIGVEGQTVMFSNKKSLDPEFKIVTRGWG